MFNKKNRKEKKKPIKYSKIIVAICITFIVLYTIFQLFYSSVVGVELTPTLTTAVYAFFGTELAVTALIRIFDKEDRQESTKKSSNSKTADSSTNTNDDAAG